MPVALQPKGAWKCSTRGSGVSGLLSAGCPSSLVSQVACLLQLACCAPARDRGRAPVCADSPTCSANPPAALQALCAVSSAEGWWCGEESTRFLCHAAHQELVHLGQQPACCSMARAVNQASACTVFPRVSFTHLFDVHGRISDDSFDNTDATVACRQLGWSGEWEQGCCNASFQRVADSDWGT